MDIIVIAIIIFASNPETVGFGNAGFPSTFTYVWRASAKRRRA
jgi:hypothetical protein